MLMLSIGIPLQDGTLDNLKKKEILGRCRNEREAEGRPTHFNNDPDTVGRSVRDKSVGVAQAICFAGFHGRELQADRQGHHGANLSSGNNFEIKNTERD
ncbi:MAG: hypothetical protein ACI89G_000137 [Minisyncoccia bacterium]|jgi:hypothetical protein